MICKIAIIYHQHNIYYIILYYIILYYIILYYIVNVWLHVSTIFWSSLGYETHTSQNCNSQHYLRVRLRSASCYWHITRMRSQSDP